MTLKYNVLVDYTDKEDGTPSDFNVNINDSLPHNIKTWYVKMLHCSHHRGVHTTNGFANWTSLIVQSSLVPGVIGSKSQLGNNLLGIVAGANIVGNVEQPTHTIELPNLNYVNFKLRANKHTENSTPADSEAEWGMPDFKFSAANPVVILPGTSTTILLEFTPVPQEVIQPRYVAAQKNL